MTIRRIGDVADAASDGGKHWQTFFTKTVPLGTVSTGAWMDVSISGGVPRYQTYIGSQYEFTPMVSSGNNGVYLGPTPAAGEKKHIFKAAFAQSGSTQTVFLVVLDALGYYPLIEGGVLDTQVMDNTATLPRYTTGEGVRCMLVATAATTGNALTATVSYTNSNGVAGRTGTCFMNPSNPAQLCSNAVFNGGFGSERIPFVSLQAGDIGVRSIQSITFSGDVGGLICAVLVRPLFNVVLRENDRWTEKNLYTDNGGRLPEVQDGAWLNWIAWTSGLGGFSLRGSFEFIWG